MKKILFICGSLEPNKSGVGDYVAKLATSLNKSAFTCTCVSLVDNFISYPTITFENCDVAGKIKFHRIPSSYPWREKLRILNNIADDEKPTFISFHYVPYAFNSRGLPILLLMWLPKIRHKCIWHLMLHELWIDPSINFSHRLISLMQKLLLKTLVLRISPSIINTTNSFYVSQLRSIGISSIKLPLFSNIDFVEFPHEAHSTSMWRFVFFGSIHPEWQHDQLLNSIESAMVKKNISLSTFTLIGHAGNYGVMLWYDLIARSNPKFIFENLGLLSAQEISYQLQKADFGVTTTPSHIIDKSSSVAAMLAHGLPVIIPRVSNKVPDINMYLENNSPFILFNQNKPLDLLSSRRSLPVDQLSATTQQLINLLISFT